MGHNDPYFFWRKAMSAPLALTLAVLFLVLCYPLLMLLEKFRKFSLEALIRWLCDYHVVQKSTTPLYSGPGLE
jgi:hypothetical protein